METEPLKDSYVFRLMYILANGVKVTKKVHKQMCEAMKDDSEKYSYFLNAASGNLIRIARGNEEKLQAAQDEQLFVELPEVAEQERRERLIWLFEEIMGVGVLGDPQRFKKAIDKGASLAKLEQILKEDPEEWIHGWVQSEYDLLVERIEEWIKSPPLAAKDDPDYWFDDDCPVCQFERLRQEKGRIPTSEEVFAALRKNADKSPEHEQSEIAEPKPEAFREEDLIDENEFEMPEWMDCAWRRVPCGEDDCPICGQIKENRQRHIEKGEDPDSIILRS